MASTTMQQQQQQHLLHYYQHSAPLDPSGHSVAASERANLSSTSPNSSASHHLQPPHQQQGAFASAANHTYQQPAEQAGAMDNQRQQEAAAFYQHYGATSNQQNQYAAAHYQHLYQQEQASAFVAGHHQSASYNGMGGQAAGSQQGGCAYSTANSHTYAPNLMQSFYQTPYELAAAVASYASSEHRHCSDGMQFNNEEARMSPEGHSPARSVYTLTNSNPSRDSQQSLG